MLLSAQDVADLTGRKRPAAQIRWLRDRGWCFEIGADGRPKILMAHAMLQLGGVDSSAPPEPQLHLS